MEVQLHSFLTLPLGGGL